MSPAFALAWLIFATIGGIIGHHKGRLAMGIVWSLILGPLGILVIALMPKTQARQQARVP